MSGNCTVYCGVQGEAFVEVYRDNPEFPPEFLDRVERCLLSTGQRCAQNQFVYRAVRDKLRLTDAAMRAVLDAIASSLSIPDVAVVSVLGAGNYGMAILVCNSTFRDTGFVIKFNMDPSVTKQEWMLEAEIQHKFAQAGLSPAVLLVQYDPRLSYIVMDRLSGGMLLKLLEQGPLSEQILRDLASKLVAMLDAMCAAQIVHQDMNWGNIGYTNDFPPKLVNWDDIELQVIDFGMSRDGKCDVQVDLASLIRGSFTDNENVARMREMLVEEYAARFSLPANFQDNFYSWDSIYIDAVNANAINGRIFYKTPRPTTPTTERPAKRR